MSAPRILGVIPARYASSRLPGKPLADIAGRSMVMRVMDQARQCKALADVVVATDDHRVLAHVVGHGGQAVMTAAEHPSGTDRCAEALALMGVSGYDAVVNIQGDEPFVVPVMFIVNNLGNEVYSLRPLAIEAPRSMQVQLSCAL